MNAAGEGSAESTETSAQSALTWTQHESEIGEYWSAGDTTRFYRVFEYKDPNGFFGHEAGWRLVLFDMSCDERQIYYGETRAVCAQAAKSIHEGTFDGTLYGPTTIDQIDPAMCRRNVWDYEDGKIIDNYVMTSMTPIGPLASVALEIKDYEVLRDLIESITIRPELLPIPEVLPLAKLVLSKLTQIVVRHYHGELPRPDEDATAEKGTDH